MSHHTHWQVNLTPYFVNPVSATCERSDLKADNFLLGFEDRSVIDNYVRQQAESPPLHKEIDGHLVYQSRPDFGIQEKSVGMIKISDFGAAVFGNNSDFHFHDIQPDQFCAPELLLKAGWTYSADICNLGMVVRKNLPAL